MFEKLLEEKRFDVEDVLYKKDDISVFQIKSKDDGKIYVIKEFNMLNLQKDEMQAKLNYHRKEFELLSRKLPNVVGAHADYFKDNENVKSYFILMDYYPHDLEKYIAKQQNISFPEAYQIFEDIIGGKDR